MMSDYWRSEVRIREFVTISQYSVSKQNIVNLWCTKLAVLWWTVLLFPNKDSISPQTFQGKIYLIQNKFVPSTLYTCLILKYHCVFVCVRVWVATQQVYPPEFSVRDWQLILPSIADGRIWCKYLGTALVGQLLPLDVHIWYEGRGAPRWNENEMYTLCYKPVVHSLNRRLILYNSNILY